MCTQIISSIVCQEALYEHFVSRCVPTTSLCVSKELKQQKHETYMQRTKEEESEHIREETEKNAKKSSEQKRQEKINQEIQAF